MKKKKQKKDQERDVLNESLKGLAIFGLVYGIGSGKIFK